MSIHTHKMVDGVRIALTPQEIAEADARDVHFGTVTRPAQQAEKLRKDEIVQAVKELSDRLARSTSAEINALVAAEPVVVLQVLAKLAALNMQ